jgi:hypothetical protein
VARVVIESGACRWLLSVVNLPFASTIFDGQITAIFRRSRLAENWKPILTSANRFSLPEAVNQTDITLCSLKLPVQIVCSPWLN